MCVCVWGGGRMQTLQCPPSYIFTSVHEVLTCTRSFLVQPRRIHNGGIFSPIHQLLGIVGLTLIGPHAKGWNKILGMGNWGGDALATGLTWGSGDACDHRHSILLHETCEKMKEPTNMGP